MSTWIESHAAMGRHPKLLRLARELGVERPTAVGLLHYLWWWAIEHAGGGDRSVLGPEDVARACCWRGDAQVLLGALRTSGWLDADGRLRVWNRNDCEV